MGLVSSNSNDEKVVLPATHTNVVNGAGVSTMQHVSEQYVPDPKLDWGKKEEEAAEKRMQELFDESNDIIEGEMTELTPLPPMPQIVIEEPIKQEETLGEFLRNVKNDVPARAVVSTTDIDTTQVVRASLEERYLELEETYRCNKKILEEMDEIILQLKNTKGVGYHFRNPVDGSVWQIQDRFAEANVAYQSNAMSRYHVAHTMRKAIGEKQGSLSLTAAKELGYQV